MLPGKRYTPEDILLILYRRMWFILVPFAIISAVTAVYVRRLPDRYRSEAVIMVEPPRVQQNLVAVAAPTRLEDRLPAIQQQVMSRTRLERIIVDLDLFPQERRTGIMEDIVERVRSQIGIQVVRGDAFRVSFTGGDPRTVMRVADRIASLLIEEGTRDRELMMEGTDQFLESQLEEARRRLIEHEKKVEQYRRQHAGELPGQIGSNLQAVQSQQAQIQQLVAAMDRDQERRLLIERQLSDLENGVGDGADLPVAEASPAMQQLAQARTQLAAVQQKLKADHPDVQMLRRTIRDLEAKVEAESLSRPVSAAASATGESPRLRRIAELRGQLEQLDKQLARNTADVQALRQRADTYLRRAEAGPTRETEMVEMNRDYSTFQNTYSSLLSKREAAMLAANLERRQIGQQFKILDQARLPARPFSPNRQRMNMMGMVAGLGVGLLLVALLEYRNSGLQTDDEVNGVLSLPVLAVVPVMESDEDRRSRKRVRLLVGGSLSGVVAGCLAVLAYTFLR
jgi:polysaccharide chain length determinant protein (PEP-CTERM system associated)